MSRMLAEHLARQCAVGREKFGPGERRRGVMHHIQKEFVEIEKAKTSHDRAKEWTDVAILALDGLLRASREYLRENADQYDDTDPTDGRPLFIDGEPTNDMVGEFASELLIQKQDKNELRDFGNWRDASEDIAIEHVRGIHD